MYFAEIIFWLIKKFRFAIFTTLYGHTNLFFQYPMEYRCGKIPVSEKIKSCIISLTFWLWKWEIGEFYLDFSNWYFIMKFELFNELQSSISIFSHILIEILVIYVPLTILMMRDTRTDFTQLTVKQNSSITGLTFSK